MTINRFEHERINQTIETMITPFRNALSGETKTIFTKDCYVAGGAIASVLQGDIPNDVDIFCEDQGKANKLTKYLIGRAINRLNFIANGHLIFEYWVDYSEDKNSQYRMICGTGDTIYVTAKIGREYALATNSMYHIMGRKFKRLGDKKFHEAEDDVKSNIANTYGLEYLKDHKLPYEDVLDEYEALLPLLDERDLIKGTKILNIYRSLVKLSKLVDVAFFKLAHRNGAYVMQDIEDVINEYVSLVAPADEDDTCCTCTMMKSAVDVTRISSYAVTCGDIQIITGSAGLPDDRLAQFDFKHCMAYKHIGYPSTYCSAESESCIRDKVLLLNLKGRADRIKIGEFTYKDRLEKFYRRGYTLSDVELKRANDFVAALGMGTLDDVLFKDGDATRKPINRKVITGEFSPKRRKGCA